jgi:hypothetical protein
MRNGHRQDSEARFFRFSYLLNVYFAAVMAVTSLIMKEYVHLAACVILTILWGLAALSVISFSQSISWRLVLVSITSGIAVAVVSVGFGFAVGMENHYTRADFIVISSWYLIIGGLYSLPYLWFARKRGASLPGGVWMIPIHIVYVFLSSYSFSILFYYWLW